MPRPSVLESLKPGEWMWLRYPNGNGVGSAAFHPETAKWMAERGTITVDGATAKVRYESPDWYDSPINGPMPPCPHSLLIEFQGEWHRPHF